MNHDMGTPMASIDPEGLATLISDAETAADNIDSFVSTYRSRFDNNSVTTLNLTQMGSVAGWVRDQLPMLNRRQTLAEHAAAQSGNSFVTAGAGELDFETADAAAEQGREDAENLLNDVGPGDDIPQEVYDLLLENCNDPDYVEAFFNAAGPEQINNLRAGAYGDSIDEPDRSRMVPLSYAAATASHRIDFTDEEWIPLTGPGGSMGGMVDLMDYGHWDGDFLKTAGNHLGAYVTPEDQATVLNAMARNPVAAAEWYQAQSDSSFDTNAELVGVIMQGGLPMFDNDQTYDALINMMDAATVDVARHDQALADQSVLTMLENVHSWEDGTDVQPVQQWFGEVVDRHMDDVYDSVTSPTPSYFTELRGDRSGVEAPADMWASFTEQAMRDEETAARLSGLFEERYQEALDRAGTDVSDGSADNANNLRMAQSRFFSDWFGARVEGTAEQLDLEYDEMISRMESGVDLLFAAGDVPGFLKEVGKQGLKGILGDYMEGRRPDYDVPMSWAGIENNMYQHSSRYVDNNMLPDGTFPEVAVNHGGDERTYNGDVTEYQEQYGGEFTVDHGEGAQPRYTLKPLEDIQQDENALAAYQAWVQDLAVVDQYWNDFGADLPGELGNAN